MTATAPVTIGALVALHEKAQARLLSAHPETCAITYPALRQRYDVVRARRQSREMQELAADLEAIIAAPTEACRAMWFRGAERIGGNNPLTERIMAEQAALVQQNAMRPQEHPVELVRRLASRGVMVQAADGDLHVSPAEMLSDADREVLVNNKAAILAALARPAAVL